MNGWMDCWDCGSCNRKLVLSSVRSSAVSTQILHESCVGIIKRSIDLNRPLIWTWSLRTLTLVKGSHAVVDQTLVCKLAKHRKTSLMWEIKAGLCNCRKVNWKANIWKLFYLNSVFIECNFWSIFSIKHVWSSGRMQSLVLLVWQDLDS